MMLRSYCHISFIVLYVLKPCPRGWDELFSLGNNKIFDQKVSRIDANYTQQSLDVITLL